ncbi:MAG: hypothetical protein COA78_14090 [Blastopirellula sp.]|nr:MAG: hypothetical protein COA78_14090 [Blastopirellula sp.]
MLVFSWINPCCNILVIAQIGLVGLQRIQFSSLEVEAVVSLHSNARSEVELLGEIRKYFYITVVFHGIMPKTVCLSRQTGLRNATIK